MTTEEAINVLEDGDWLKDYICYRPRTSSSDKAMEKLLDAIAIALHHLRTQREAEKNDSLTLDDLLQMDGKPVYVVWDGYGERWALVHGFWKSKGVAYLTYSNGASDLIEILLNKGAKIYRHPPKEALNV